VAELILSKLPETLQNNYATQLSNVLKQKRAKKSKKNEGFTVTIRANNENIVNLLKNLVRSSS
jgi:non-homologous end joining protein Ku